MCIIDFGPGTEYLLRTTQPSSVILDKTPSVSTRCSDALTRSYCTLWPSAFKAPFTILYPEFGIRDLMFDTNVSSSSSVSELYSDLTDRSNSASRLCTVRSDTPKRLAIHLTGKFISSKLTRYSRPMIAFGRPLFPRSNCAVATCVSFLCLSKVIAWCRPVKPSHMSTGMMTWGDTALRKTNSWTQINSKKSISTGIRERVCSKRDRSLPHICSRSICSCKNKDSS